jgi:glycosyltransferase involved in cell wall biosynthesis
MVSPGTSHPLVSVIIPCYNQAKYLKCAIESVLNQTYQNFEIIVVDDGSQDNTREIAESFERIKYIYQQNQGLSAARITGIRCSEGEFLVFLDSDDWLLPAALETNKNYLLTMPGLAFVSGAHQFFYESDKTTVNIIRDVPANNYCELLQSNYIAMIATVMFKREVFDDYSYDTSLRYCEDYDLYLKIARRYPVSHHTNLLAVYRIHDSNMSLDFPGMLKISLAVLERQKKFLKNPQEKDSFKKGRLFWVQYYTLEMYNILNSQQSHHQSLNNDYLTALSRYNKSLYLRVMARKHLKAILRSGKQFIPHAISRRLFKSTYPAQGSVDLGDLNRTTPLSTQFGYDRGGPVDRYYIENFLEKNKSLIKGRVLEIGDNEYTLKYGMSNVQQSDIFHVDATNPKATFIGDLSDAPMLPDNSFDCIILTQTLQFIYHHQQALRTCYRVLKPGGTLLLTVPGISHIDQGEWKDIWLWSYTQSSIKRMFSEVFETTKTKIQTHGNVLVATAFLYGMGLPELKKSQLDETDQHYQVIITACASK